MFLKGFFFFFETALVALCDKRTSSLVSCPPTGRLILYDEDTTTRPEGGWKKLNTLGHYNVPDQAQLTLIPKQSSIYMLILSDKSDKSHHKYDTLNRSKLNSSSPPLSRATSPLNHDNEAGVKVGAKVCCTSRQVKASVSLSFSPFGLCVFFVF